MNSLYCSGNGECLEEYFNHNTYKQKNMFCAKKCSAVMCANYIVCNSFRPKWSLDRTNGLCSPCYEKFGKLKIKQYGEECPVCMYEKVCVKLLNCDHYICVDCFKRFHYGPDKKDKPRFPYSEKVYQEYYEQPGHIKWHTELPLVKVWLQRTEEWEAYYQNKYNGEENLRKCPVCTK